jgi:Ca2+-binding EF-hand superfamily protein
MSISSVGTASGAGNLSQILASTLSRIKSATSADSPAASTSASATTDSPQASNALTGTDTTTLSDQVIGVLVMMQAQSSDPSQTAATSGSDPVTQAFTSLDSNGDGSISQSELESAITNAGGTSDQADSVYAALGGTDQTGISQDQFATAAQAGAPPPGGPGGAHGHHHHHSGSSESASSIFNALDTNQDGSVSSDELSAALDGSTGTTTSTSSTSTDGSSDAFSTIDSNGDGSVSQTELTRYLDNMQKQASSDQTTLSAFQQIANQSYNTSLGLMASSAGTQMATA